MRESLIVNKLKGDGLLPISGRGLDLGCGEGAEAISLSSVGLVVDAVDRDPVALARLAGTLNAEQPDEMPSVRLHEADIRDFQIDAGRYDCIVAKNSLPFIASKAEVDRVMRRIVAGLNTTGCAYLTVFGTKDGWVGRRGMSFWEYEEILSLLASCGGQVYHSTIEEGYGKTLAGNIKYWNVFKFVYLKHASPFVLRLAA